jgi:hypothetical protein
MRFKCRKDQIEQVIFGSRPFEWTEIKNVSLIPLPQQGL